jgi:hypothetical protein
LAGFFLRLRFFSLLAPPFPLLFFVAFDGLAAAERPCVPAGHAGAAARQLTPSDVCAMLSPNLNGVVGLIIFIANWLSLVVI